MTSKKKRDPKELKTLDELLDEEGIRTAFQAIAIKEVVEWQVRSIHRRQSAT